VDPFEFIMVLVSIIMGLGIATLLRGVVRSLRPDTTTTPGLVHAIWIVWVFVMPWAPGGDAGRSRITRSGLFGIC